MITAPAPVARHHLFVHSVTTDKAAAVFAWELRVSDIDYSPVVARGVGCVMSGPGADKMSALILADITGVVRGLEAVRDLEVRAPVVCARNSSLQRIFPMQSADSPAIYHEAGLLIDSLQAVRGPELGGEVVDRLTAMALTESPNQPGEYRRFRMRPRETA